MSATRLYEWRLLERRYVELLYTGRGPYVPCPSPERVGLDHLARFWRFSAWMCLDGSPGVAHQHLAEGEALVAAARKGLVPAECVAAGYRIGKARVTFYVDGMCTNAREFHTVTGPTGEAVTAACRLYPTSPLALVWMVARDHLLESGLAREAA